MLFLVSDLLDFFQMRHGKFRLVPASTNFREMISELLEIFKITADGKDVVIRSHIDQSVPQNLYLDAKRMQQVLINLISNALKFTQRGTVDVSFSYDENTRKLSGNVKDTGLGINKED